MHAPSVSQRPYSLLGVVYEQMGGHEARQPVSGLVQFCSERSHDVCRWLAIRQVFFWALTLTPVQASE